MPASMKMNFSEMLWLKVCYKFADVSEVLAASMMKAKSKPRGKKNFFLHRYLEQVEI
jgi:hypothetical protein